MRKTALIATILLTTALFPLQIFAVADSTAISELERLIQEKEQKIESLRRAANSYATKMEDALNQSKTIEGQIGYLDNQITKTELDISATQLTIDKTKLEIEDFNDKIEVESEKVNALKEKLVEYIKT